MIVKRLFLYWIFYFSLLIKILFTNVVGSDFLLINNSAESSGHGNSGVGKFSDISFAMLNPASVSKNVFTQLSLSHIILNNNLSYTYVGIGFPVYNNILSFHLLSLYYPESFELMGGEKTGYTINYSDDAIIISDALNFFNFINIGMSLKFIRREIAEFKSSTFGFDVGILKGFSFLNFDKGKRENFSIGIAIRNIGKSLKFIQTSERLPLTFAGGIAFSPYKNYYLFYDLNKTYKKNFFQYIGFEYITPYYFIPRVGLKIENEITLMTGVGLKYKIGYLNFNLNYSVNLLGQPIKYHTISLNLEIRPIVKTVIKTKKIIKEKIVEKPVYVPIIKVKKITKVAVLRFENTSHSKDLEYLTDTIPEAISSFLAKKKDLKVIDQYTVYAKLKSLSVKIDDFDTLDKEILLGKILGVDNIIRGSFVEVGNVVLINTKLIDIKSGTIISSDQIKGDVNKDLFVLLDKTSQTLLKHISDINSQTNY